MMEWTEAAKWKQINRWHDLEDKAEAVLNTVRKLHEQGKLSKAAMLALNDTCAELRRALTACK